MVADGRLHLTAVMLLAPHLTVANRDAVLSRAVHRSKREVQEVVAEPSPRSDVPLAGAEAAGAGGPSGAHRSWTSSR
ncbi:MAG TPA: hypothetical protein VEQ10_05260 [Vicinamibacteria bacterium]|nr:hypothetical protein [Vicinamibacteria bacterium]